MNQRENRENNNIYYIYYKINKPEHDINSINNLHFVVNHLYGMIEKKYKIFLFMGFYY